MCHYVEQLQPRAQWQAKCTAATWWIELHTVPASHVQQRLNFSPIAVADQSTLTITTQQPVSQLVQYDGTHWGISKQADTDIYRSTRHQGMDHGRLRQPKHQRNPHQTCRTCHTASSSCHHLVPRDTHTHTVAQLGHHYVTTTSANRQTQMSTISKECSCYWCIDCKNVFTQIYHIALLSEWPLCDLRHTVVSCKEWISHRWHKCHKLANDRSSQRTRHRRHVSKCVDAIVTIPSSDILG